VSEGPARLERLDAGAQLAATPPPPRACKLARASAAGGSIPAPLVAEIPPVPDWAPSAESPAVGHASN